MVRLLVLLVLLLPMLGASTAQAQVGASGLVVESQTARPKFPDTVEFDLKAHGFNVTRAELDYRLVGSPVTDGIEAEVGTNSSSLDLQVNLDLATHYIPPGAEVAYHWTLTGEWALTGEQADIETPDKTFIMSDPRHNWRTLSDAQNRVTVHWYDGDQGFGQSLATTASSALDRLQHDIGAQLQSPASVYVYSSQDELIDALPKNIPEWIGAKAFPEYALILASISGQGDYGPEVKRIVPHELSHLLLYQVTRNPYNSPPAWMDEGLAVHNEEAHDPAEQDAVKQAAEEGRLLPLKSLSGSFGADDQSAVLSYGESRSAIDFIFNDSRYGPEKFARTVAAFREGVTYDDALKAGLGITVDELDQQWRASLPYKAGAPGTAPAPRPSGSSSQTSPADVWSTVWPYLVLPLALCGLLFVAGAVVTLIVVVRRRSSA